MSHDKEHSYSSYNNCANATDTNIESIAAIDYVPQAAASIIHCTNTVSTKLSTSKNKADINDIQ